MTSHTLSVVVKKEFMTQTILVVDDKSDNLRILSTILKEDYQIWATKCGKHALEIAKQKQPHLILLDVIMPNTSGYDVIQQLKANEKTKNIPVIFTTGLSSEHDECKGFELGAVDYLSKPFHHDIVKARVRNQMKTISQNLVLKQVANLDVLTELPNRRKWKEDCELLVEQFSHYSHVVIGIIDIDHFKHYNDYYGHHQGDLALTKVSQLLSFQIQSLGGCLYRFGGEEFVFLLPCNNADQIAEQIMELSRYIENSQLEHLGSPINKIVTISGGACIQPISSKVSVKRMFEKSDELLYQAKNKGRTQILVSNRLNNKRKAQHAI